MSRLIKNVGTGTTANAGRVTVDSEIMLGKPVIRGTRVTVELILPKIGEGATDADILDMYPHLTAEDIRAAKANFTSKAESKEIASNKQLQRSLQRGLRDSERRRGRFV